MNNSSNIKGYVSLLLILPLLLLPFVKDRFFVVDSYYYILLIASMAFVLSTCLLFRKQQVFFHVTLLDIALAIFIFYLTVSAIFVSEFSLNHVLYKVLFSSYILFICSSELFRSKNDVNSFVVLIIAAGIIYCIISVYRMDSLIPSQANAFNMQFPFENPAILSAYTGCIMPFCFSFILFSKNKLIILTNYFISILFLFVLYFSQARAAWISASFSIFVIFSYRFELTNNLNRLLKKGKVRIVFVLSIASLCLVILFIAVYKMKPQSVNGRILIYKTTLAGIQTKPLYGSGYGTFPQSYGAMQANYLSNERIDQAEKYLAGNTRVVFNDYLQIVSKTGIIGYVIHLLDYASKLLPS